MIGSLAALALLPLLFGSFTHSDAPDSLPSWAATALPDLSHQTLSGRAAPEWAEIIDATWGPGAPVPEKIAVFDAAWKALDEGYGAYMNLDVDMRELRHIYRSELERGVSQGRFVAIMNHLSLAMKDLHTVIFNRPVNGASLSPGVPLFVIGGWLQNSHFGASLTPLLDDSLLVYRACPNHPLGLEPGDLVLGYDGIPWMELYPLLLEAELPIWIGSTFGSTDAAMRHAMLISAGMNWHLFETIDIRRHATDEVVHLATDVLRVTLRRPAQCSIRGNEQLRIPGVPMPDHGARHFITFGIAESTSIGYIYVASWSFDPADRISEQFEEAIRTLMFERDTAGLIIDYRQNTGGSMLEAHDGYSLLFDTAIRAVAFDVRGDPNDHLSMVPHRTFTAGRFVIPGDPSSSYDRPIAVLTGPGAWSNGDWESLRTRFHPRARVFGKPTNGAFTPSDNPSLGPDWRFSRGTGSGYLIEGHKYVAHTSAPIDEEVWLSRDDVAAGRDTVVIRAIEWIRDENERAPF